MKYLLLFFPFLMLGQNIVFADEGFKRRFTQGLDNIDTNRDGEVSYEEALQVTKIEIQSYLYIRIPYYDFTGIRYFTNLETLNINAPVYARSLDVSNLTHLKNLAIYSNQYTDTYITTINIQGCTALEYLTIQGNLVTDIDLSGHTSLLSVGLYGTGFSTLDFSGLPNLEYVAATDGKLQNVIFRGNTSLSKVYLSNQPFLTGLNMSEAPLLTVLDVSAGGNMSNLYLSNNYNLEKLNCAYNKITTLNVSGMGKLERLLCRENQLTNLDLTGAISLKELDITNNLIEGISNTLDFVSLQEFYGTNNKITHLDLTHSTDLINLFVDNNLLQDFKVHSARLYMLSCSNNRLTSLNLEQAPNIGHIDCTNNQIGSIYMKNVIKNPYDLLLQGSTSMNFDNNPIHFACVDDFQVDHYKAFFAAKGMTVEVTYLCSGDQLPTTTLTNGVVFPNPVGDLLNINNSNGINEVRIFDSKGRLVLNKIVNSDTFSENVGQLRTGLYLVETISNNKSEYTKIIKN